MCVHFVYHFKELAVSFSFLFFLLVPISLSDLIFDKSFPLLLTLGFVF